LLDGFARLSVLITSRTVLRLAREQIFEITPMAGLDPEHTPTSRLAVVQPAVCWRAMHASAGGGSFDERHAAILKVFNDGRAILRAARTAEAEAAREFLDDKRFVLTAVSASENWPLEDVAILALRMHAGASLRALRQMCADSEGSLRVIDRLVPIVTPDVRLEGSRFTSATVPMNFTAWLGVAVIIGGVALPTVAAFNPGVIALSLGVAIAGVLLLVFNRLG